jgi:hypothetical protein
LKKELVNEIGEFKTLFSDFMKKFQSMSDTIQDMRESYFSVKRKLVNMSNSKLD